MTWLLIVLGVAFAVGLGIWWLERPLWHRVDGARAIESFLADLVSPLSPWPLMYVQARTEETLLFSRQRIGDGFRLTLEVSSDVAHGETLDNIESMVRAAGFPVCQFSPSNSGAHKVLRIDLGQVGRSTLSEAGQATRIVLAECGVQESKTLRVRYAGPMDQRVVAPRLERLAHEGGLVARLIAKTRFGRTGRD